MVGNLGGAFKAREIVAAAITVAVLGGAAIAHARTNYDGNWSVLILTDKGPCDRAYRYPVRIANGAVRYGGQADFTVTGRVQASGAITVTVRRGRQSASGAGRLSGRGGGGRWRGGECAGTWTAERR